MYKLLAPVTNTSAGADKLSVDYLLPYFLSIFVDQLKVFCYLFVEVCVILLVYNIRVKGLPTFYQVCVAIRFSTIFVFLIGTPLVYG